MKRVLLILGLVIISVIGFAQSSPVKIVKVANATTTFGHNLPIGTKVHNLTTGETWVAIEAVDDGTLTTRASSFEPDTKVSATLPLLSDELPDPTISIQRATSTQDGYLSSTKYDSITANSDTIRIILGDSIPALRGDINSLDAVSHVAATLNSDDADVLSLSGQDLTFVSSNLAKLDENETVTGAYTFSNVLSITNTTQSTSTTSGSLKTLGGLGVSLNGYIGGSLNSGSYSATTSGIFKSNSTAGLQVSRSADSNPSIRWTNETTGTLFEIFGSSTVNGATFRSRNNGAYDIIFSDGKITASADAASGYDLTTWNQHHDASMSPDYAEVFINGVAIGSANPTLDQVLTNGNTTSKSLSVGEATLGSMLINNAKSLDGLLLSDQTSQTFVFDHFSATAPIDAPIAGRGQGINIAGTAATYVTQLWASINRKFYFRTLGDGSDWNEIYHSSNSNLSTVDWAANNITAAGTGTFGGILTVTNTTDATSTTTGSFHSDGGGSFSKNLYVGGDLISTGVGEFGDSIVIYKETGTTPISPVSATLYSMTAGTGFNTDNWAEYQFNSIDGSGLGSGKRAYIGSFYATTNGSTTGLRFTISSDTEFINALEIDHVNGSVFSTKVTAGSDATSGYDLLTYNQLHNATLTPDFAGIEINGASINTAGALSNVAYLNQVNNFNVASTTNPTNIFRNTSYSSTDASGESSLGLYFLNHGAAKIAAYKTSTNTTGIKLYGEYGFNAQRLLATFNANYNVEFYGNLTAAGTGTFGSSVAATTGIFTNLTDNYIPVSTASGLVDSPISTNGSTTTFIRAGKTLTINPNYGETNTKASIEVTTGMGLSIYSGSNELLSFNAGTTAATFLNSVTATSFINSTYNDATKTLQGNGSVIDLFDATETLNLAGVEINGASINTAGTLSNVAYLNKANVFTNSNTISSPSQYTMGLSLETTSSQTVITNHPVLILKNNNNTNNNAEAIRFLDSSGAVVKQMGVVNEDHAGNGYFYIGKTGNEFKIDSNGNVDLSTGDLTAAGTIQATTGIFTNLTDNYVPISTASGLDDSPIAVSGSNVGIGTTVPKNEVDVFGNISLSTTGNVDGSGSSVKFYSNYTGLRAEIVGEQESTLYGRIIFKTRDISGSTTEKVRISSSGWTGIGYTSSIGSEKFAVNGGAYINGSATATSFINSTHNDATKTLQGDGSVRDFFDGTEDINVSSIIVGNNVTGDTLFADNLEVPTIKITTGASDGYYLKSDSDGNGTWAPFTSSQTYKGTVDGTDGTVNGTATVLIDGTGTAGDYYRCDIAGTYDYGSGSITLEIGDDLFYNGTRWQAIAAGTSPATIAYFEDYSLPSGTGAVDYEWTLDHIPTSSYSVRITINGDDLSTDLFTVNASTVTIHIPTYKYDLLTAYYTY